MSAAAVAVRLGLADSEVAAVVTDGASVEIRLAAASAQRADPAHGGRPVAGFVRGVLLRLHGTRFIEQQPPWLGRLAEGRVHWHGRWHTALPLPAQWHGPVRMELAFANRSVLVLAADGLQVVCEGGAGFDESLAC